MKKLQSYPIHRDKNYVNSDNQCVVFMMQVYASIRFQCFDVDNRKAVYIYSMQIVITDNIILMNAEQARTSDKFSNTCITT